MKTTLSRSLRRRQSQKGSAVLIVIILLGVMLVLIASNTKNLNQLKREIDLIEQKQLKRQAAMVIQAAPVAAGLPPAVEPGVRPGGTNARKFRRALANQRCANKRMLIPGGETPALYVRRDARRYS